MYMVQQRVTTAVREGFADADPDDVGSQLEHATQAREWLAGLTIDPDVRAGLLEPIMAVEEALAEIARRPGSGA